MQACFPPRDTSPVSQTPWRWVDNFFWRGCRGEIIGEPMGWEEHSEQLWVGRALQREVTDTENYCCQAGWLKFRFCCWCPESSQGFTRDGEAILRHLTFSGGLRCCCLPDTSQGKSACNKISLREHFSTLKLLLKKIHSLPLLPTRVVYSLPKAYEHHLVNIFLATIDPSWQA